MSEISRRQYEELRQILERQNGRTYTFVEAKEIGDGLMEFFALLIQLDTEDNDIDKEVQQA